MSLCVAIDDLVGLMPRAANSSLPVASDGQFIDRKYGMWKNDTAVTTTTAIAELNMFRAPRKGRIVQIFLVPDAAVTGTATNNFAVTLAKRLAGTPSTTVNLTTITMATPGTDDIAAFGTKDLSFGTTYANATSSNFDCAIGDIITVAVTKNGTGMTFPVASVYVTFESRD